MASLSVGPEIEELPDEETTAPLAHTPRDPPGAALGGEDLCVNHAVSAARVAKDRGNSFFQDGAWRAAVSAYTDGLVALPSEKYLAPQRLALYTNRAMCYIRLQEWELCKADCDVALSLDSSTTKAWYRRATALFNLGDYKAAMADVKTLLKIDAKNRPGRKLFKDVQNKLKEARRRQAAVRARDEKKKQRSTGNVNAPSPGVMRGFFAKAGASGVGLYDEKLGADASDAAKLLRRIRSMAKKRKAASNVNEKRGSRQIGPKEAMIERTFEALMTKEGFQKRIYPGLRLPENFDAPQTLGELLEDSKYDTALESIMPEVVAKAERVLKRAKEKAAKKGDIMPKDTEEILRPQILLEAFAREVVKVINKTSAQIMSHAATSMAAVASPADERAGWNQLSPQIVSALRRGEFFAAQREFLGDDWGDAILDDLQRLAASGRLQPTDFEGTPPTLAAEKQRAPNSLLGAADDSQHTFAIVSKDECGEEYPALAELLEQLMALPFEYNKKVSRGTMLAEPNQTCCAVSRVPLAVGRREVVDGLTRGEWNGRKISFVYTVDVGAGAKMRDDTRSDDKATDRDVLSLRLKASARQEDIELTADSLVVYDSCAVSNEVISVEDADPCHAAFFVTMFASYSSGAVSGKGEEFVTCSVCK